MNPENGLVDTHTHGLPLKMVLLLDVLGHVFQEHQPPMAFLGVLGFLPAEGFAELHHQFLLWVDGRDQPPHAVDARSKEERGQLSGGAHAVHQGHRGMLLLSCVGAPGALPQQSEGRDKFLPVAACPQQDLDLEGCGVLWAVGVQSKLLK
eukprot:7071019-Lingulodinium_polyedra.AAC.1